VTSLGVSLAKNWTFTTFPGAIPGGIGTFMLVGRAGMGMVKYGSFLSLDFHSAYSGTVTSLGSSPGKICTFITFPGVIPSSIATAIVGSSIFEINELVMGLVGLLAGVACSVYTGADAVGLFTGVGCTVYAGLVAGGLLLGCC